MCLATSSTEEKTMDEKRRRYFHLENTEGERLAYGVLYNEGNVQVLWRADHGYAAEQYSSLTPVLGLMPNIALLRFEDTDE